MISPIMCSILVSFLSLLAPDDDPARLLIVDVADLDGAAFVALDLDVVGHTTDGQGLEVIARSVDLARLDDLGASYRVAVEDLEAHYASRLARVDPSIALPGTGSSITPGFSQGSIGGYHSWAEVVSILDQLAVQYPDLITPKQSLGQSIEGRDIWAVMVSDNPGVDEGEPEVRIDALHHAREPMGMESTLYFIIWLLENHGSDPLATYLVDEREIWYVPVVNPDGYHYNAVNDPSGGGLWRKNRRDNPSSSSFGVDLNRNYPYEWGFDNNGSSSSPSSSTFRGAGPASEPETQALVALMAANDFQTALSVHCYSDVWLLPWGYDDNDPLVDSAEIHEIAALATATLAWPYGSGLALLGYPANGVTNDYDYGAHGTFSYTPEIGDSSQGFWPSTSDIIPLATEMLVPYQETVLSGGPHVNLDGGVTLTDLGNGDGFFEPGEAVGVQVGVRNAGRGSSSPSVVVQSNDADLSVTTGSVALGPLGAFTSADNGGSLLVLTIDAGATPGASLPFTVLVDWEGPDEVDASGSILVSPPGGGVWADLGGGSPGINGVPSLFVTADLFPGNPFQMDLADAAPGALMLGWLSFSSSPVNVLGGTVYANPFSVQIVRVSDGAGGYSVGGPWPGGVPSATDLFLQFIVQDASVPAGLTLSNARTATTP